MSMTIGEKIRFFRERKGLSQANMAEILEMSVQGYGNIERGDTDLVYSRLELISKELEVKPEDIVGFAERNSFVNSNHNNFNNHSSVYQTGIEKEILAENAILKKELEFNKEKIELLEDKIKNLEKIMEMMNEKKP